MKKKQKQYFLDNEGDAYLLRNYDNLKQKIYDLNDPIINSVNKCLKKKFHNKMQLLEIGCGDGKRLHWMSDAFKLKCFGVEPSKKAVKLANSNKVRVIKGTADILDFESNKFDFVVFGFCLYLCDREDLFQIAKEADRVLKQEGYIIIYDFYSLKYSIKNYHHLKGLNSYKMDYKKLFDWHPYYNLTFKKIFKKKNGIFTKDKNNWTSLTVMKKNYQNK